MTPLEARPSGAGGSLGGSDRLAGEDVIEGRIVALVEEFSRLSGATVERPERHLMVLLVDPEDARHFGGRRRHELALSISAVQQHPDAELPVVGGTFWTGLLKAIRGRGARRVGGTIPRTVMDSAEVPDVPVQGAAVSLADHRRDVRRLARLLVKVTLSAGTTVEEELLESAEIDLATGLPLPDDVRAAIRGLVFRESAGGSPRASAAPSERLMATLIRDTEGQVAERVHRLQSQSERDLSAELTRIDRYYQAVKEDIRADTGPGSRGLQAVEHEHQRRREEETRRHRVRVDVEPVQLVEQGVAVEEASWNLTSPDGVQASLRGQRYLVGDGHWGIRCPRCGESPEALTVCRGGHPIGVECSSTCSVCGHGFCAAHGHEGCAIDGAPVCEAHAEECFSCGRVHCTEHRGVCSKDHHTCVECLVPCAVCQRLICRKHRVNTVEEAPLGTRPLCSDCVVYCEGATSEPVGVDEATPCGTCGRHICRHHQVPCVVDHKPHCSSHLRRADRSRRFFCGEHEAHCDDEPNLLFAADEIHPCVECGSASCNRHGAACHGDERWHCLSHLERLTDRPDAWGCAEHRTVCHVDGRAFSIQGTTPCEICGRLACRTHSDTCSWCGAGVCTKDATAGRCVTCANLRSSDDPPDAVVTAAAALVDRPPVRAWHVARDGGRYVAQLDLGWTRRIVLTVPHGSATATRVIRHSLFGSSIPKGR